MSQNDYQGVDDFVQKKIRAKAKALVGSEGFRISDLEDIEQELIFKYCQSIERLPDCPEERLRVINAMLDNQICSLIRRKKQECRNWRLRKKF